MHLYLCIRTHVRVCVCLCKYAPCVAQVCPGPSIHPPSANTYPEKLISLSSREAAEKGRPSERKLPKTEKSKSLGGKGPYSWKSEPLSC